MSQISRPVVSTAVFGALAVSLTLGAMQLASGQEFAGRFQALENATDSGINRAAKADRAVNIPIAATATRTISMKVDSLSDTSILVRIPVVKEARNIAPAPLVTRPGERKPAEKRMAVACEPTVSVLTEVAKLLQPGRCVT